MYLSIGNDMAVRDRSIIGIFDLDNTTTSKRTREFLDKAEKDGEVRYFTSVNQIKIYNRSRIESNNYETSVGYIEDRQVTEIYFVEHTNGPTWEYMSELVGVSDTQN